MLLLKQFDLLLPFGKYFRPLSFEGGTRQPTKVRQIGFIPENLILFPPATPPFREDPRKFQCLPLISVL
jgi:hypothetical protein